ncbi:DUF2062 domain-containing protein [Stenotrophobium rhamnosiphilum]|uniref:DUF2062 domain-containing protein n=1 Tax=Stenotrophobium rhamnosiphilum TaxID=2029166 RepID=A0A2T5MFA0_9GAMM|nr:DUF2062 domain-containing protein [Stenotrophobium rhamnosiphilum]PTU31252.1 DUF2062 domain-containing protein [Stenotrophobium rhamnosiphilum]
MVEESFWQRRVVTPILGQLKQGITPEKIALTLSLGSVLGVFPILGATTALCAVIAWRLKLNQPIIQLINYLMYPIHLLLLLPFYRAGETLFGQEHLPIFSITDLAHRFELDPLRFLADFGMVGVYGVVVWCLVAPPSAALLYFLLRGPIRAMSARQAKQA